MLAVQIQSQPEAQQNWPKCPFSSRSSSSGQLARRGSPAGKDRLDQCPQRSAPARINVPPPRKPTDLPDLRRTPSSDLLYLPPLLSLLPAQEAQHSVLQPHQIQYTLSRLPEIDATSIALHQALHHFKPTTREYAYEPYHESFNWQDLSLPQELSREW